MFGLIAGDGKLYSHDTPVLRQIRPQLGGGIQLTILRKIWRNVDDQLVAVLICSSHREKHV